MARLCLKNNKDNQTRSISLSLQPWVPNPAVFSILYRYPLLWRVLKESKTNLYIMGGSPFLPKNILGWEQSQTKISGRRMYSDMADSISNGLSVCDGLECFVRTSLEILVDGVGIWNISPKVHDVNGWSPADGDTWEGMKTSGYGTWLK